MSFHHNYSFGPTSNSARFPYILPYDIPSRPRETELIHTLPSIRSSRTRSPPSESKNEALILQLAQQNLKLESALHESETRNAVYKQEIQRMGDKLHTLEDMCAQLHTILQTKSEREQKALEKYLALSASLDHFKSFYYDSVYPRSSQQFVHPLLDSSNFFPHVESRYPKYPSKYLDYSSDLKHPDATSAFPSALFDSKLLSSEEESSKSDINKSKSTKSATLTNSGLKSVIPDQSYFSPTKTPEHETEEPDFTKFLREAKPGFSPYVSKSRSRFQNQGKCSQAEDENKNCSKKNFGDVLFSLFNLDPEYYTQSLQSKKTQSKTKASKLSKPLRVPVDLSEQTLDSPGATAKKFVFCNQFLDAIGSNIKPIDLIDFLTAQQNESKSKQKTQIKSQTKDSVKQPTSETEVENELEKEILAVDETNELNRAFDLGSDDEEIDSDKSTAIVVEDDEHNTFDGGVESFLNDSNTVISTNVAYAPDAQEHVSTPSNTKNFEGFDCLSVNSTNNSQTQ